MAKIKAGIIGAAGYTAGELIRLLINHPQVDLVWAQSESQAGKLVSSVHTDLVGETNLSFTADITTKVTDVVFFCKGHGESAQLLQAYPDLKAVKVIDLSQDFRLKGSHDFVYGLPEFNKDQITQAHHIANPGCFATCLQLSILPALANNLVAGDLHISGITGSTGAGQSFSTTSHYSWRHGNASAYKVLTHQHLLETGESVQAVQPGFAHEINFVPYRGAFTRGIICTTYFKTNADEKNLKAAYEQAYANQAFTHVVDHTPDVKQVVNTNKCLVHMTKVGDKAVITSVIDNLLKGASGQAVQNMNIIFGLDETLGLKLKPSAF